MELDGDPEVQLHVEGVVVRDERPRQRAARDRLQHGRLDLDEPSLFEVMPDRSHRGRPDGERAPSLLGHPKVDVALAVPRVDIADAVPLVRELTPGLGQQHPLPDLH